MKKTININLAGIHFHIDEDAYQKLYAYLESIRISLKNAEGSEEILQDIEARIAELFSEEIDAEKQVVTLKEVEEVISIMGQPEDYQMEDDSFEETEAKSAYEKTAGKKLFRDIDNKYIGGVSSGLGHYIGVDAVWIRLIWILLVLAGMGSPMLIYILLWILVPAAITTSDKLKMTGEPINISNIEKKFKEGFDNVTNSVKNADYGKYGNSFKSGIGKFFDVLSGIFKILIVLLAKLAGILLILISTSLFIGLVTGTFLIKYIPLVDRVSAYDYYNFIFIDSVPVWLMSVLFFFAIGIPLFVLFTLGLRLLINHLKPVNTTLKILLFAIWFFAIIGLVFIATKQYKETAFSGRATEEKLMTNTAPDTLNINVRGSSEFDLNVSKKSGMSARQDKSGNTVIYSNDIRLNLKPTRDSLAKLIIHKKSKGNSFSNAKDRADAIEYELDIQNENISLNGFFTTETKNNYRDQEVEITLLFPEKTVLFIDPSTHSFIGADSRFQGRQNREPHYYGFINNEIRCLDCPEIEKNEDIEESLVPADSIPANSTESWEERVLEKFEN